MGITSSLLRQRPVAARKANKTIEPLLEAALGRPKGSLRDIHTELMMVDTQRAILARILGPKPAGVFSIEEVELFFDAIEEYGDCSIAEVLGVPWSTDDASAPPPLLKQELQAVIRLCALSSGLEPRDFVLALTSGMAAGQAHLRGVLLDPASPGRDRARV